MWSLVETPTAKIHNMQKLWKVQNILIQAPKPSSPRTGNFMFEGLETRTSQQQQRPPLNTAFFSPSNMKLLRVYICPSVLSMRLYGVVGHIPDSCSSLELLPSYCQAPTTTLSLSHQNCASFGCPISSGSILRTHKGCIIMTVPDKTMQGSLELKKIVR